MRLTDKHLGKSSLNKLRDKSTTTAASKMEFFVTLVNVKTLLTNVTRRFIIDVTRVLDTPLKLVNIKSLKKYIRYNRKMMSTTKDASKPISQVRFSGGKVSWRGAYFWGKFSGRSGGNFPGGRFSRRNFPRNKFLGGKFPGFFSLRRFWQTPINSMKDVFTKYFACFILVPN